MEETLCHQDIAYKNLKIKEYMNHLISKNNNQRCECCPYGYHVNLDFVEFAKDISNSHNELQKIRRYQRKLERAQNNILNNRDGISENIKESFTVKKTIAQELTCSSSESNSTAEKNLSKPNSSEILYLPNSFDDCTSRSSDESIIQSPSFQSDLNNSNVRNIFRGVPLPEDNYKKSSSSSKSFVVSYEHLMSIREQMSASLKRVQDLEIEAKNAHELRQKLDRLTHDNRELQQQLDAANTTTELARKFNTESTLWRTTADLPTQLLSNLERILQRKLTNPIRAATKSRTTQTDVNGTLIVDTLSYLAHNTNDTHTQSQPDNVPTSPKIHRRNFGVTVRPTHHHFTQQISFSSSKSSFKPDDALTQLHSFVTTTTDEIDQKVGILLHNLLGLFFKNLYNDAIQSLKEELTAGSVKYKYCQSQQCQTIPERKTDSGTQVSPCEYSHHKSVQAQPIKWNKYSNTHHVSLTDSASETVAAVSHCEDRGAQTVSSVIVHKNTQANICAPGSDFVSQYHYKPATTDISSNTDPNLIDDLISEQIENTMALIQEELKKEIESKMVKSSANEYAHHNYRENVVNSANELCYQVDNVAMDYHTAMVDSHICGSAPERSSHTLVRSQINYLNFTNEKVTENNSNENQSSDFVGVQSILNIDTDIRNTSTPNDDSSESAGSSPLEGCYYTTDHRIDYRNIDQIEECDETVEEKVESVTETEQQLVSNAEKVLIINSNTIKQDGDTSPGPEFPELINDACNLFAIWMNDSTTTCSKDLNESLTTIQLFWFGLTRSNLTNLKYYIDKFKSFNTTLLQRIINMADTNGNTCLHYAVSEGRWSIVQQILETEQADVSKTNKAGYTVLMLAAVSDVLDEGALKLLISRSEIDKQSMNDARQTALMVAASKGKVQLVQLLLEAGALVNITDSDGSSALMCACDNGHLEVVRIFLSRADIDTELEDKTGSNAMQIALDNAYKDIALLIFARNNLQKSSRSKRRSGSNSHPTSPLSPRKFK